MRFYACFLQMLYMMQVFVISVVFLLVAIAAMCIRIFVMKDGTFHSEHISQNQRMKENNISCATSQDRQVRRKTSRKLNVNEL